MSSGPGIPPVAVAPEPDDAIVSAAARPGGGASAVDARGLAVALLGASAAGRAWQARRVDQKLRDGRVAPFAGWPNCPRSWAPGSATTR